MCYKIQQEKYWILNFPTLASWTLWVIGVLSDLCCHVGLEFMTTLLLLEINKQANKQNMWMIFHSNVVSGCVADTKKEKKKITLILVFHDAYKC